MSSNSMKSISTIGTIVGAIAGANVLIDRKAMSKKLNDKRIGEYFSWRHGNVFYTAVGEGKPVLLIHHLHHDESSYEWKRIIPRLKDSHRVYALDLLGCGKSDKPNITYANYLFVQLVTAFIKNVIKEKTDVIVTGDSVPFVIMAKKMEPELIDKIIAINPADVKSQLQGPDRNSKIIANLLCTPIIGRFMYNLINRHEYTDYLLSKKYYHNPYIITKELKDYYYETAHISKSRGRFLFASIIGRYTNMDIRRALKDMEGLYIIASRNRDNSLFIVKRYLDQNPDIETCYISNVNMLPQLENPEKTCECINRFL